MGIKGLAFTRFLQLFFAFPLLYRRGFNII